MEGNSRSSQTACGTQEDKARSLFTLDNAIDFLVGRIAQRAEQEGVPLSEVERKMLYFSETAWTLPDMAAEAAWGTIEG